MTSRHARPTYTRQSYVDDEGNLILIISSLSATTNTNRVPSKRAGRKGTRRAWKRAHPPGVFCLGLAFSGGRMPNPFDLTMRERQVMELVCEGKGYPEISAELGITPRCARRRFELAVIKVGVNASRTSIAACVKYDRAMRAR